MLIKLSYLQRVDCPCKLDIPFRAKDVSTAANFAHENRWHLEAVRKNYINYTAITITAEIYLPCRKGWEEKGKNN